MKISSTIMLLGYPSVTSRKITTNMECLLLDNYTSKISEWFNTCLMSLNNVNACAFLVPRLAAVLRSSLMTSYLSILTSSSTATATSPLRFLPLPMLTQLCLLLTVVQCTSGAIFVLLLPISSAFAYYSNQTALRARFSNLEPTLRYSKVRLAQIPHTFEIGLTKTKFRV